MPAHEQIWELAGHPALSGTTVEVAASVLSRSTKNFLECLGFHLSLFLRRFGGVWMRERRKVGRAREVSLLRYSRFCS